MPKPKSIVTPDGDEQYVAFLKIVHLSGLGIDESACKLDRSNLAEAFSDGSRAPAEVTGKHEISSLEPKGFVVLGHYNVSVKDSGGSEVVSISCTYSALFLTDRKAKASFVERFAQNEVRLVFWPYFRQFVSDATFRMSINPLLLPLTSET